MGNCFTVKSHNSLSFGSSQLSSAMSYFPSSPKRRRFPASLSSSTIPSLPSSDLPLFYDLGPVLGRGQFGIIRRCVHRSSGVAYACKSIPKFRLTSPQELADVLREIDIMQHLSGHPHIVRLHHAFQDRAYVHLVMELCEGGELFDRIMTKKRYSEPEAAALMKSLVETVKYCHSMGVMHRDLKPENILLADRSEPSEIKLADFGLALRFSPGEKFSGMAGSAYYIAPEVLRGQYSEEIDMWSAGVILYVLLSGMPPFWGETDKGILDAIKEGKLNFFGDPWNKVSRPAKGLIRGMLCSDPTLRLTPAQVLEHPWILRHSQKASQLPRVPRQHHRHDRISPEASYSDENTVMREALSCASCSPVQSSCAAVLSDVSEGSSFQIPTDRDYDAAPATPPLVHPVTALSSISSLSSVSPSSQLDRVQSKADDAAQSSTDRAPVPGTGARAQLPRPQAPDIFHSSNVAEDDFNRFFVDLINGLDRSPPASSSNFTPIKMDNGCTCTLVKTSATEQTLLVEMRQGRFLIVHDKMRKRIGWKLLQKQRYCVADSRISEFSRGSVDKRLFQQSQAVF